MDGIAIMDSGNQALMLCRVLERKGYVFEVTSTPCQIAKGGCSYCLRFPLKYKDLVLQQAQINNITIREIYRVERNQMKYKYIKIY
jgi:ribosomal protein S8